MLKIRRVGWIMVTVAFAGLSLGMILLVFAFTIQSVTAQDSDDKCVFDASGLDVCTANDFGVTDATLVDVITPCAGLGTTATVKMALTMMTGSPERYDVGFFINTDGAGDAISSGNACYHTYLRPLAADDNSDYNPIGGPFWQGEPPISSNDICADSEGNNTGIIFTTINTFDIACTDTDNDGLVDVHICASYDNNRQNTCQGAADAVPGTPSKCGCTLLNLSFTPTAVTLNDVSTSVGNSAITPLLLALSILTVLTIFLLRQVRSRRTDYS